MGKTLDTKYLYFEISKGILDGISYKVYGLSFVIICLIVGFEYFQYS